MRRECIGNLASSYFPIRQAINLVAVPGGTPVGTASYNCESLKEQGKHVLGDAALPAPRPRAPVTLTSPTLVHSSCAGTLTCTPSPAATYTTSSISLAAGPGQCGCRSERRVAGSMRLRVVLLVLNRPPPLCLTPHPASCPLVQSSTLLRRQLVSKGPVRVRVGSMRLLRCALPTHRTAALFSTSAFTPLSPCPHPPGNRVCTVRASVTTAIQGSATSDGATFTVVVGSLL